MAHQVKQIIVGVDVSKDQLDVYEWDSQQAYSMDNEVQSI